MLLEFSFSNFLSFRDRVTFSMVTSALKDKHVVEEDAVFTVGGENPVTLGRSAAVFGANASGKSNFITALSFLKWMVLNSSKDVQAGESVPVKNFALSCETASEPSVFEIVIMIGEDTYRFGCNVVAKGVLGEWLYVRSGKKRSKEVELFYREGKEISVHPRFAIGKELVEKKMIRDNALLLSLAGQFNEPIAVDILKWFVDTAVISEANEKEAWDAAVRRLDDPAMRRRMVDFAKYADLGIDDILKGENGILTSHIRYEENGKPAGDVNFLMNESESEGTLKYFALSYPIIDALENGKRIVVDELGAKLHTLLVERVISLFSSHSANPKNAQLIVTLHDTNVLSSNLLRRDQIWFTRKDSMGASSLYSLSDYKVRNDASYEKDYLLGKYGATPIIDDLTKALR